MRVPGSNLPPLSAARWACRILGVAGALFVAAHCRAAPPPSAPDEPPPVFSLGAALGWALQRNPEIAAVRQQHGIAAAEVVIARTFPYNPLLTSRVTYAKGPPGEVTNRYPVQFGLAFEVELFGQWGYRRQSAQAALSRTDWEIANREMDLTVRVLRAFQGVLYREEKVRVAEETLQLNQQVFEGVQRLVKGGKLGSADLIVAQTEVNATRAQVVTARSALAVAQAELARSLGLPGACVRVQGAFDSPECHLDPHALLDKALASRPDLRAREAAVTEAEARLRLQRADRFGNPTIGPNYEQDNTHVNYPGVEVVVPIPVFNRRRGEIERLEAERARAVLELQQADVTVRQDVAAALTRLEAGLVSVRTYRNDVLPALRTGLDGVRKLFLEGDPKVDVLRVIDLQRKLLQARDGLLDAVYEVNQAQADLVAAVGDPLLAAGPCPPPPEPVPPPDLP
jgi:cobalt-zinc-cadmium efflux system outer membrane protein